MSNAEYVANLDEDQLDNLIEQAKARKDLLKKSGWVKLWVVSVGWANVAWFREQDHSAAVDHACAEVKKEVARRPNLDIEMAVSLERFRPEEVADLLGRAAPAHPGEEEEGSRA